ncbi:unnamed protein product [Rotaria sp. Silwood2]|nr:unnamed protein product [Rotaria sp. Silwood2]CAF2894153.1 unnamed protein product [Rotaria sp. Silwood2]CAF3143155.1 unnamed protein product [Rotaria sp. Silwood2]CAF3312473.1 unnamed protein product [Rotaria sp. Silwood2]
MTTHAQAINREHELLSNEIKRIIKCSSQVNNDDDEEVTYAAFKHYHDLRVKGLKLEVEQSILSFIRIASRGQVQ